MPIKILKKEEGGNLPHCPKLLNTKYSGQKKKKSREFPEKAAYTIQDHKSQITNHNHNHNHTYFSPLLLCYKNSKANYWWWKLLQSLSLWFGVFLSPVLFLPSKQFFWIRPKKKKKKNENQENPRVSIAKISVSIFLGVRLGLLLVKSWNSHQVMEPILPELEIQILFLFFVLLNSTGLWNWISSSSSWLCDNLDGFILGRCLGIRLYFCRRNLVLGWYGSRK